MIKKDKSYNKTAEKRNNNALLYVYIGIRPMLY